MFFHVVGVGILQAASFEPKNPRGPQDGRIFWAGQTRPRDLQKGHGGDETVSIVSSMVVDPDWYNTDPDPAFLLNPDPS
jgi:hypothetical protein